MHIKVLISIQCVEKLNQLHIHKRRHHGTQRRTMNRQVCTHYDNDVGHNERAHFFLGVNSYKRKHTYEQKSKEESLNQVTIWRLSLFIFLMDTIITILPLHLLSLKQNFPPAIANRKNGK